MVISMPRSTTLRYIGWTILCFFGVGVSLYLLLSNFIYTNTPPPKPLSPHDYQYGVMIDAGSSGSRVYLYKWLPGHSDGLLEIEQMKDAAGKIQVMKTSPGLSAYEDNPAAAYRSIKSLLLYASLNIPNSKLKETPLYILCTAGMRLLAEEKRNNIMNVVASNIQQNFSFYFKHSHIEVIDGRTEGVYGWIAVNYLLGRFNHAFAADSTSRPATVGAMDMGGASMQITYEVPRSEEIPSDLSMDIDLGCNEHVGQKSHSYHLYSTTFLGYGTNEARKTYVEALIKTNKGSKDLYITDPCLPKGMQETQNSDVYGHVTLTGGGDFAKCRQKLHPLLNIPNICARSPCSMNGVFQPPINFYKDEMYGVSEYWYTMNDLLKVGGHYKEQKFIKAASEFCSTDWRVLHERYKSGVYPNADQHRFQYQCFKSAWVLAVLHDGHKFPSNYKNFMSVSTLNGEIIQWTYGAMIYRTRYLPLREKGVEKVLSSRGVSKLDAVSFYAALFCFLVVLLAILYWVNKLRKMRSSFIPTTLQDLSEQYITQAVPRQFVQPNKHSTLLSSYDFNSMINFNDVCAPPQNSARTIEPPRSGVLPRSYSESLLTRPVI